MDSSDTKPLVFISCGQFTEEEKHLGNQVVALVSELTPFKPYFAEEQSSLEGLTKHVFGALNRSIGFIGIMHHRGTVSTPAGSRIRASVWIEQEIAIAAFLRETLGRNIYVAAYMQQGISLEGVREKLLLNAKTFTTDESVLGDLRRVLPLWQFSSLDVVQKLTDNDVSLLKALCEAVIQYGWPNVSEQEVLSVGNDLGLPKDDLKEILKILDGRKYTETTWADDDSFWTVQVTPAGFEEYARKFFSGYESVVRSVISEVVEKGANCSADIAKSLAQPDIIVKYILSTLGQKEYGHVMGGLNGTIWITDPSPELKRMLRGCPQ